MKSRRKPVFLLLDYSETLTFHTALQLNFVIPCRALARDRESAFLSNYADKLKPDSRLATLSRMTTF
ncbi:hypothetical protein GCM10026988_40490 [Vibrio panuliri]